MDWISAISDLLGSIAWPATLIAFLLLFRREISQRLRDVTEVKYPGGSITMREVERLEVKLQDVEVPAPGPPSGPSQPALPTNSMLAVVQSRLDIERELYLLSRYGVRDRNAADWNVERYLRELEHADVLDSALCDSVREFIDLANRLVHEGADAPGHVIDRAAAAGSSLLATLHQQRLLRELAFEFEAHGLWHMHRHLEEEEAKKYYFWSAVAATLPEFEYNYDVYREAAERYNEKLVRGDHAADRLYVLPLDEFVAVLQFRESELMRIAASWSSDSGKKWDIEWRWPEEWGHIGWSGPILHHGASLWAVQDELVRTRAALSYYRARIRQEGTMNKAAGSISPPAPRKGQ